MATLMNPLLFVHHHFLVPSTSLCRAGCARHLGQHQHLPLHPRWMGCNLTLGLKARWEMRDPMVQMDLQGHQVPQAQRWWWRCLGCLGCLKCQGWCLEWCLEWCRCIPCSHQWCPWRYFQHLPLLQQSSWLRQHQPLLQPIQMQSTRRRSVRRLHLQKSSLQAARRQC